MKLLTRKRLVLVGVVLLALPLLAALALHFHGRNQLEGYRRQLVARGERLEVEELLPETVPAAIRTAQTLLVNQVKLANPLSMMGAVAPGRSYAVWKQPTIPEGQAEAWATLAADVRAQERALNDVRDALIASAPAWQIDYRSGFSALLPHLAPSKALAQTLATAGLVQLRAGDREGAIASVQAMTRLSGFSQHDRTVIGQLVADAINAIAFSASWELLQTNGWSEAQLARLQAAWDSVDPLPPVVPTLEMERAMMLQLYRQLRQSHRTFYEITLNLGLPGAAPAANPTPPADISGYPGFFFGFLRDGAVEVTRLAMSRSWAWIASHYDELDFLQHSQANIEFARNTIDSRLLAKVPSTAQGTPALPDKPRSLFAIFARQIQTPAASIVAKSGRARVQRDLMRTRLALERYRTAHGRLPASLSELAPAFLDAPPIDVMDNRPLRYRLADADKCVLYSVGEDGRDDGGDPTPLATPSAASRGAPSFFRPAKDIVWPEEASPAEIAAALEKASKRK